MKTMRTRALVLLAAFLPLAAHGVVEHDFTDVQGRKMSAEIIGATETTVRVKMRNGQQATIDLAKLSEADQAHVASWRDEHADELGRMALEEENRRRAVELPRKLVAFCKAKMGKQVGNGECWTLADEAFKACGLERPGKDPRVWGRLLDLKTEKIEDGDIVEYVSASFSDGSRTGPGHTAVVIEGGRRERAIIADQNWGGKKTVRKSIFDSGTLIEGEVMVYRPDYSKK
jgi:hypothetical protein